MFRWIALIACLIGGTVGLAVGVMNPDPVTLRLLDRELSLALGSLMVVVFVLGFSFGLLLFLLMFHLPSRWSSRVRGSDSGRSRLPDQNA